MVLLFHWSDLKRKEVKLKGGVLPDLEMKA
jgi:hypothetical protein